MPGPALVDTGVAIFVTGPQVVLALTRISTLKVHDPNAGKDGIITITLVPPGVAVNVPLGHEIEAFAGLATIRPAGRASFMDTPVSVPVVRSVFGLVNTNVAVVTPPWGTEDGLKVLMSVGGIKTHKTADAGVPAPPSVEVGGDVVLFLTPNVFPVTVTEKLHANNAFNDPPANVMLGFGTFVVVKVPPQTDVTDGVVTVTPSGRVSVKPIPVRTELISLFGLERLKLSTEVSPSFIAFGVNAFVTFGGATTVSSALALTGAVLPLVIPALFSCLPAIRPTMSTVMVQVCPTAKGASDKKSDGRPGPGATGAPHSGDGTKLGGSATTMNPDGKLSMSKILSTITVFAEGFFRVRINLVFVMAGHKFNEARGRLQRAILGAMKLLVNSNGATTSIGADAVLPLPSPEVNRPDEIV